MRREKMDISLVVMAGLVVAAGLAAYLKTGQVPVAELGRGGKLRWEVTPRLLLGFALAGFITTLIPEAQIGNWLGTGSGLKGIGVAWAVGSFLPGGGPYVTFPIMVALINSGAAVGPMITLMAAKSLLGPVRVITWELPLLGGQFFVSRLLASFFMPPVIGVVGQFIYGRLFHS